jgi:hypothetical protein
VHGAFNTVVWVVCIVAVLAGVLALISSRGNWEDFGKNRLTLDSEAPQQPGGSADLRERDEEIRQLLEARNARRMRRGEQPLDVEQELARLTVPAVDPELRGEIRDLVIARNFRRTRAGKPPLDVEAEVEREIRELRDL